MQKIGFFILTIFAVQNLFAQHIIKGFISDVNTNEKLIGVLIIDQNNQNSTTTNQYGFYELQLKSDTSTIKIMYTGYKTLELKVDQKQTIDIQLEQENIQLNTVVITALGLKRETKDLGYAVQKVSNEELSKVQSINFVDNLAGKFAGVTVTHGATGVGSTSKIVIRGEASFTNNNPLFVVDGVPINNNTILNNTNEAAAGFQEVDFGNGGMEINSDDIESVNVLKGPNAAALYGTRASNGVIIITTKKGVQDDKVRVNINNSTTIDKPFKLPKFQNKYGQGNSGQFEFVDGLGGGVNDNISYSWGPALNQGTLIPQFDSPVILPNGTVIRGGDFALNPGEAITATPFVAHPNNLKDFYQTGFTINNNIAISSGFQKGSYRISLSDLRSESFIPGVNLDRNNVSTNLVFQPTKKITITSNINYINSRSTNRPSSGYGSENINYSVVAWGPRSLNINSLRDYWQPGLEEIQQFSFNYTFFDNPFFTMLENRNSFNRDRLFGIINANYSISKNLNLNVTTGMDYSNEKRNFLRHYSSNRFKLGAYAEQDVLYRENNSNFLLSYKNKIAKFNYDIAFGGNQMEQTASFKQTEALSLAQPGIFNFTNAASPINVFQNNAQKRINSLYAIAKLSYNNIFYLDITGRNDWSSALATPVSTKNTSFFYHSFSGSYIVSNSFKLPKVISFAKARASWAQVGNDTDPYQTSSAFVAGIPYNSQPTFTSQNTIPNFNLLPEKTSSVEFGADIRFFKDRIFVDFTYYNALTQNQIIALPVPVSSGFTQQVVNGGTVKSQGIELMLGVNAIKTKSFSWNSFFNFSRNVSTILELPDGVDKITLAYSRVYDNENQTVWFQIEEGGKIGDMYGTGYLKNENGDFVIDNNGNFIVDNSIKKLGNYNPDFILGLNNNFKFKNWDFSFLLDWRQGGNLISRTLALGAVGGQLIETENRPQEGIVAKGVVNTGTAENPIWKKNTKAISAESYYRQYYDRNHEENNMYNASYLKLRQVYLSYTFKSKNNEGWLKDNKSFSVAFIARNVWAWSSIPHFDPEQLAVQGNRFVSGVEDMSYPSARSYGLKLSLQF